MTGRVSSRSGRFWTAVLSTAVLVTAVISIAPAATAAPTGAQCDVRANDTPSKLVECVRKVDLMTYLKAFQDIADANPGPDGHPSRNSGEPGYKASVDYVAGLMQQWGYNVTIQTYKFDYYAYTGLPSFTQNSPTPTTYTLLGNWGPGRSTGAATADLQPAGGIILPPTPSPSSTSGCTSADFGPQTAGRIALIQRGGCNFGVKVLNAQAAGAKGVVIFNEGQPGRQDLVIGSLVDANGTPFIPTIPVAFTTFDVGNALYQETLNGPVNVTVDVPAIVRPNADDYNVIAESPGGDPNHVLVVDAHLDAIYGAGMLDNATGSAALLDIANMMKHVTPTNRLRFIWFGGEEIGLLGSTYYVNNLTSSEANKIGYDLDADVFGTPNYTIGILDPAGPDLFTGTSSQTFPNRVYKPSQMSRDMAVQFFDARGFNHEFFSPVGTDAISFNKVGIPAGGLLTGQDCCKTAEEVALFGGQEGNFEGNLGTTDGGCVDNPFRWCDNIDNVDPKNFELMSKAFADMVARVAFDTKIMSSSGSANYKPKLPIAGEIGKHFPTS
jgi:hypothetical protein